MVEMALELQTERMRLAEAMTARDATVLRLSDAYHLIRQKAVIIERLEQQIVHGSGGVEFIGESQPAAGGGMGNKIISEEVSSLQNNAKALEDALKRGVCGNNGVATGLGMGFGFPIKSPEPPPRYEENMMKVGYLLR